MFFVLPKGQEHAVYNLNYITDEADLNETVDFFKHHKRM